MPENAPPNVRGRLSAFAASSRCRIIGACGGDIALFGAAGWDGVFDGKEARDGVARYRARVGLGRWRDSLCRRARACPPCRAEQDGASRQKRFRAPLGRGDRGSSYRLNGERARKRDRGDARCRASRQRRERCEEGDAQKGPDALRKRERNQNERAGILSSKREHAYGSQCEQPASQGGPPFEACWVCRWARLRARRASKP